MAIVKPFAYHSLGKPDMAVIAADKIRATLEADTLRAERDAARAEVARLRVEVERVAAERDEARALGRMA